MGGRVKSRVVNEENITLPAAIPPPGRRNDTIKQRWDSGPTSLIDVNVFTLVPKDAIRLGLEGSSCPDSIWEARRKPCR